MALPRERVCWGRGSPVMTAFRGEDVAELFDMAVEW
jgi:hypothetical protein